MYNKLNGILKNRLRHDISNLSTCKLLWTCICNMQLLTDQTMARILGSSKVHPNSIKIIVNSAQPRYSHLIRIDKPQLSPLLFNSVIRG